MPSSGHPRQRGRRCPGGEHSGRRPLRQNPGLPAVDQTAGPPAMSVRPLRLERPSSDGHRDPEPPKHIACGDHGLLLPDFLWRYPSTAAYGTAMNGGGHGDDGSVNSAEVPRSADAVDNRATHSSDPHQSKTLPWPPGPLGHAMPARPVPPAGRQRNPSTREPPAQARCGGPPQARTEGCRQ